MKFRSLLYIVIALVALAFQIVLAKQYGGIGCAIAVAGALLLGQGLIMNIYYSKKQGINIGKFWSEILKMSIVPIALTITSIFIVRSYDMNSWGELALAILIFCAMYIPLFWSFSMNKYERSLIKTPLQNIISQKNLK
jgi:O-antigen/teichoic acid export membrane protein